MKHKHDALFEHDILFEFLSEEDKNNFLVWDNVILTIDLIIIATYRAPFDERIKIPLVEYEAKVKQLERENKLNKLID